MTYGHQPGYDNASYCGAGHGTFGYLGEQGYRHDLGQGDTTDAGIGEARRGRPGHRLGQQRASAATASRQAQPGGSVAMTAPIPGPARLAVKNRWGTRL